MAGDARILWMLICYESGQDIPLPSYPSDYSGKFNIRLPRSLHRDLAESADEENVSLNQYVTMFLARGDADVSDARRGPVQSTAHAIAETPVRYLAEQAAQGRVRRVLANAPRLS